MKSQTTNCKLPSRICFASSDAGGQTNRGFTLLETLVAIAVLTSVFLGPLTLASYSIRSASVSQNQLTAFYLAQEALEYVKNRRDSNAIQKSFWLNNMAPVGLGNGLCRNANGCIVDVRLPDTNPNSISMCGATCPNLKYDSASGFYTYGIGTDTIFTRRVNLNYVSDYEEKIDVTISWQEKLATKSFVLEENIFNWP